MCWDFYSSGALVSPSGAFLPRQPTKIHCSFLPHYSDSGSQWKRTEWLTGIRQWTEGADARARLWSEFSFSWKGVTLCLHLWSQEWSAGDYVGTSLLRSNLPLKIGEIYSVEFLPPTPDPLVRKGLPKTVVLQFTGFWTQYQQLICLVKKESFLLWEI